MGLLAAAPAAIVVVGTVVIVARRVQRSGGADAGIISGMARSSAILLVVGGRANGLVGVAGLALLTPAEVAAGKLHDGDDQPAAHLAKEHLEGLDYGLLEVLTLGWIRVVAVAYALVVLGIVDKLSVFKSLYLEGGIRLTWYLVRRVLQTPVNSIMETKNGIKARERKLADAMVGGDAGCTEAGDSVEGEGEDDR